MCAGPWTGAWAVESCDISGPSDVSEVVALPPRMSPRSAISPALFASREQIIHPGSQSTVRSRGHASLSRAQGGCPEPFDDEHWSAVMNRRLPIALLAVSLVPAAIGTAFAQAGVRGAENRGAPNLDVRSSCRESTFLIAVARNKRLGRY
jgi:hypothetical protein